MKGARGHPQPCRLGDWTGQFVPSLHPSAILRAPDKAARDKLHAALVEDLAAAHQLSAAAA